MCNKKRRENEFQIERVCGDSFYVPMDRAEFVNQRCYHREG